MQQLRTVLVIGLLSLAACRERTERRGGPIVLGDTSLIVTETDPKYLTDYVEDIKPTPPIDTTLQHETNNADTAHPAAAEQTTGRPPTQSINQGAGLKIEFKEVTVFIPGVQTRTYRNQNPSQSNSATYQITGGSLQGNKLQISGAGIQKVSQRYMTDVVATTNLGKLNLDALSNTTEWVALKGGSNGYPITGLENPVFDNASPADIRNAVNRAIRGKRFSRRHALEWESALRNVRSVKQAPLSVSLRSVMWKIEGKDASGKSFAKQVRIDI